MAAPETSSLHEYGATPSRADVRPKLRVTRLLLSLFVTAASVFLAAAILPGFDVGDFWAALLAALVIGLLTAVLSPLVAAVQLPFTVATSFLMVLVLDAVILLAADRLTEQAVVALQKAAGLGRDGVFGPATRRALEAGTRPHSRIGGTGVEIDKARQLLLVVRGGQVTMILNTSTGSGQPYTSEGQTHIATTPAGWFTVFRSVNGEDVGPLGALWRPRYFNGGIAVHGYTSVPAYPASHGCARVSMAAIDMIWASDIMPIGSRVVVY